MADKFDKNPLYYNVNKIGTMRIREGHLEEIEDNAVLEQFTATGAPRPIKNVFFADGSDSLANRGFVVSFQHVASGKFVHFKSFITAFNESYNSDWNSEPVYGRTDPIKMFKQTTRSMTLGLIIPAASEGEGFENLGKLQDFLSFLYPTYTDVDNALTISQSPLVRMRVMNLIRKTQYGQPDTRTEKQKTEGVPPANTFKSLKDGDSNSGTTNLSQAGASEGLLGHISNVAINHNLENNDVGSFILSDGVIIPKAVELTVDFQVLHERKLGWQNGNFSDQLFPYGIDLSKTKVRTEQQIINEQLRQAKSAVESIIARRAEEEAKEATEAQRQNAIAAGYLVADGVTADGRIRYALTKRGERAAKNKRAEAKKDFNPFNARPYPDEDAKAEANKLAEFLSNTDNFIS